MPNPEQNKASLETFLDNSTVNFFRVIADKFNLWHPHGTALGVTSIGFGGYPTGEGAYTGYFPFRTKEGKVLLMYVGGPFSLAGVTMLHQLDNRRGHDIKLLDVPKGWRAPMLSPNAERAAREVVYKELETNELPITDKRRESLLELFRAVKECEFMACRKYFRQSRGDREARDTGFSDRYALRLFTQTKNAALDPSREPSLPVVSRIKDHLYEYGGLAGEDEAVFNKVDERDWRGVGGGNIFPESFSVPVSELGAEESANLEKYRKRDGKGRKSFAWFCLNPKSDPEVADNWQFYGLGSEGSKPLERRPSFLVQP